MQTILCLVDFSSCSESAAMYAAGMAKEFNSSLMLLHVYETPETYTDEPVAVIQQVNHSIKQHAERELLKLKSAILESNTKLRVSTALVEGEATTQIIEAAQRETADIIIMGTSGKGKLQRFFIGSTSSKVISHSSCPVLCIPKGVNWSPVTKLVYATDLKSDNIAAASCIVNFVRHFDAEIIFVFVDDSSLLNYQQFVTDMKNKIKHKVHYNKISGYVVNSKFIAVGIEEFLKTNPADALVMLTHQKHFPDSLIHPGFTKEMLAHIHIPLLVLTGCEKYLS